MTRQPDTEPTYLGDGVYATFDGYQLWVIANDINTGQRVALEPAVFDALLRYAQEKFGITITVEVTP